MEHIKKNWIWYAAVIIILLLIIFRKRIFGNGTTNGSGNGANSGASRGILGNIIGDSDCVKKCKIAYNVHLSKCKTLPASQYEDCRREAKAIYNKCIDNCKGGGGGEGRKACCTMNFNNLTVIVTVPNWMSCKDATVLDKACNEKWILANYPNLQSGQTIQITKDIWIAAK